MTAPLHVEIYPAIQSDARDLAANLRDADRAELEALFGPGPVEPWIANSVAISTHAWAAKANGEMACMFGCAPHRLMHGEALVWLLGTPLVEAYSLRFLRENRRYLDIMLETWPVLLNHVDWRNELSIRWLGWLGAKFEPAVAYGHAGLPFLPFRIVRKPKLLPAEVA